MQVTKYVRRRLVVRGYAPFPIDILRYDRCCPATEGDARLIERLGHQYGAGATETVTLLRFVPLAAGERVTGSTGQLNDNSRTRWKSEYSWEILSDDLDY